MTQVADASPTRPPRDRPAHRLVAALLVLLALGTAVHACLASRGKSSTYDEPVHALSSWLIVNAGDFRVNPEHPALWKYVAGAPLIGWPLTADLNAPAALNVLRQIEREWPWTLDVLYRNNPVPGDGEALVARARLAMSVFVALLALIVARWSWAWGGPLAAVVATLLLALDPNVLAHGGLVTNDVAATGIFALAAYLTWRLGVRFDLRTALTLALLCAAGVNTKFTCLLLAPTVGGPLLYRAFDAGRWRIGRRDATLVGPPRRLAAVLAFGGGAAIIAWLSLWPVYQFRNHPTAGGARFDDRYARGLLGFYRLAYEQDLNPAAPQRPDAELARAAQHVSPGPVAGTFLWLTEHRWVPQAWGYGLNYANARSFVRGSYLMGEYSNHGFTSFFPLAVLFKTPLATLALLLACGVGGLSLAVRRLGDAAARWKLVCLFVPPLIYFGVACASPLNIGVRHVLPVFPPMYVAAGVLLARAMRAATLPRTLVPIAVGCIGAETLAAFPDYLPFFNAGCGGARGGLALLGDSNLDWGQDLAPLARWYKGWRADHPTDPFYLSYFGTVPPRAYGIDYINAAPGYDFEGSPPTMALSGGVYAVSATHLQGIYSPQWRDVMVRIREAQPWRTINDTIYLYRMPSIPTTPTNTPTTRPSPGAAP